MAKARRLSDEWRLSLERRSASRRQYRFKLVRFQIWERHDEMSRRSSQRLSLFRLSVFLRSASCDEVVTLVFCIPTIDMAFLRCLNFFIILIPFPGILFIMCWIDEMGFGLNFIDLSPYF